MKSKEITLGGIMVALTVIILYGAAILPINKLAILTIASAVVPICIIRANVKTGILVFSASSIISLFFIPLNIWLLYTLVFGGFGIVKYYIEKLNKVSTEMILKFLYFNGIFILTAAAGKILLNVDLFKMSAEMISKYVSINSSGIILVLFWIIALGALYVIDYALTLIISFYLERIHK